MWLCALLIVHIVNAKSSGCGSSPPVTAGSTTGLTIPVGSDQRRYLLTIPDNYDKNKPYPLMLSFHGYGMDADTFADYDGTVPRAKRGDMIVAHPDGSDDVKNGPRWKSWNAVGSSSTTGASASTCDLDVVTHEYGKKMPQYASCRDNAAGCGWTTCRDDVKFAEALLNFLEGAYCIDESQVRLQGESNGGMLVYEIMQSHLAPRFSTMTAMIASPGSALMRAPVSPVSFLGIWGEDDPIMPAGSDDGPDKVKSSEGYFYSSSFNTTRALARSFGCGEKPAIAVEHAQLKCWSYPDCTHGEVMQCILNGQRHSWPWYTDVLMNSVDSVEGKPNSRWADYLKAYLDNRTQVTDYHLWEPRSGMGAQSLIAKSAAANPSESDDGIANHVRVVSEAASGQADPQLTSMRGPGAKELSVFTKQATVHRALLRS